MKKQLILLAFTLTLSCTADNVTPTAQVIDNFDPSQATLLKQGTLIGIGHTVSGQVGIYDNHGTKVILLDPYSSQSGPDLKVYLSKDMNASDYIKCGKLKSTMGKQSYIIPGTPDISQYNFVHIWCEQFTVVFGRAEVH